MYTPIFLDQSARACRVENSGKIGSKTHFFPKQK